MRRDIEDAIRKHLSSRGMTETAEAADLNVRFSLGRANRVAVRHPEGTLVIDFRDPQKRDLVWRGIAVNARREASRIGRDLDGMVRKAIEKYPPKSY